MEEEKQINSEVGSGSESTESKSRSRPKKPIILALAIVVALVVGISALFVYINKLQTTVPEPGKVATPAPPVERETKEYIPIAKQYAGEAIALPKPNTKGTVSLEEALASRRSVRSYAEKPLSLEDLGQVLWAAQGITDEKGHRTAPSAKGVYPFSFYVVVRNVTGLKPGLYHYLPDTHSLRPLILQTGLLTGESQQSSIKSAPAVFVYGAIYDKMELVAKFPAEVAVKVTLQESGHIGQNIYLQATALGLSTVVVGGFNPAEVKTELKLPDNEKVIYLQPLGYPAPVEE